MTRRDRILPEFRLLVQAIRRKDVCLSDGGQTRRDGAREDGARSAVLARARGTLDDTVSPVRCADGSTPRRSAYGRIGTVGGAPRRLANETCFVSERVRIRSCRR